MMAAEVFYFASIGAGATVGYAVGIMERHTRRQMRQDRWDRYWETHSARQSTPLPPCQGAVVSSTATAASRPATRVSASPVTRKDR